jgi:signal transduction histidine kinase
MNDSKFAIQSEDGVRFFGETVASVSHEIKNCLAIMNESAGLLQDLVMLNQKGKPLEPVRIDRIAQQISGQIKRADTIVKNLNSFAHSADLPEKNIDLSETISLTMALAKRSAANRGVSIHFILPQTKIITTTHPFLFMHVIRKCLDFSMATVSPEKVVEVVLQLKEDNIEIVFKGLEDLENQNRKVFFMEKLENMLEKLGAHLDINDERSEMCLVFDSTHQK